MSAGSGGPVRSVLIATRGTPAVRAAESCRALGLVPVAVLARSDPQAVHTEAAASWLHLDDVPHAYDSVDAIVTAAERSGVDAVYPGWGAVAEDPSLASRLAERGIRFVGAPASALAGARDKGRSVAAAERIGIPVLPHAVGRHAIEELVATHGLPVVLKPPGGSQGNGVVVVRGLDQLAELPGLLDGDDWYAERFAHDARVVGVTVAVDTTGAVIVLGERESLLLAGNRKLVEAAPVCSVSPEVMGLLAVDASRLAVELGVRNVATVEFLVFPGGYAFLEVNARLTGAFRICEAQTGIDVVALQLRIASGVPVAAGSVRPDRRTHAVQAHLYLTREELARAGPRRLTALRLPADGHDVLVDCCLDRDQPVVFDTLPAQVLATGVDRGQAEARMARAVAELELTGAAHHGPDIVAWWFDRAAAVRDTEDEITGVRP
jgi:biotin carboxylase